MKTMNALQLRQSLGKALTELQKVGEPILIEKGRKPAAFLISLRDFHERFAEKEAASAREELLKEMRMLARPSADKTLASVILHELRGL
jgi:PHD/YefM family antitoxin component YafN of YafNO toxin-antitoxin module